MKIDKQKLSREIKQLWTSMEKMNEQVFSGERTVREGHALLRSINQTLARLKANSKRTQEA
jgi:hypothetical protein